MVAPPSAIELLNLRISSKMADDKVAQLELKRKQLLAANKQKARILLLGISSDSYATVVRKDK
jgi:hypothetical protein